MGFKVRDSGGWGLGCRVWDLGVKVWDSRIKVVGVGKRGGLNASPLPEPSSVPKT